MYGNFNMGAGFAIYLPARQVKRAQKIIRQHKLASWEAGRIEAGPKQVVIKPKNITFSEATLAVR